MTGQYFQEIDRWFLENPNEERRFVFNLNHSSVVFDVGAFDGAWARTIYDRYRSKLFCFEPSPPLFNQTCQALGGTGASIFPIALGGQTGDITFYDQGDSSSSHRSQSGASSVTVQKVDICEVLQRLSIKEVDLLKINIEGGEYELLERIASRGIAPLFRDILVQFHPWVENYAERRRSICASLAKTHRNVFNYNFVWELWSR